MQGVYGAHSGEIVEVDFVGSDADYGALDFEEFLDSLALLEAGYVCCEPKVGDRGLGGIELRRRGCRLRGGCRRQEETRRGGGQHRWEMGELRNDEKRGREERRQRRTEGIRRQGLGRAIRKSVRKEGTLKPFRDDHIEKT